MTETIVKTRIEKWKSYRDEILNEGILLNKISNESITIKHYRALIDNINPKILNDLKDDKVIAKLISIDTNKKEELKKIDDFLVLIDEINLKNINNEIDEWLFKNQSISIIDEANGFSNKWLNQDENYVNLLSNKQKIDILTSKWSYFQFESKDQIVKLDKLGTEETTRIAQNDLFLIKPGDERLGKFSKLFYILPGTLCVIFIVLIVVLLVIKIGEI